MCERGTREMYLAYTVDRIPRAADGFTSHTVRPMYGRERENETKIVRYCDAPTSDNFTLIDVIRDRIGLPERLDTEE